MNNNHLSTLIQNIVSHVDETIYTNIDFIQHQINEINNSYIDIYNNLIIDKNKQEKTIEQLNEFCTYLIHSNNKCDSDSCDEKSELIPNHIHTCCKPRLQLFVNVNETQTFIPTTDIIFITMVGGGGAGGIGYIEGMYFYSGGGGGAGSCIIKKPVMIKPETVIKIKVGNGGCQNNDGDGKDTIVEIINLSETITIIASGGFSGNPKYIDNCVCYDKNISGGKGGCTELVCFLKGNDGEDGIVSIPSHMCAIGGNGGASSMHIGGKGGGNYFSGGGSGGHLDNIIGKDGQNGSGGGGSCPRAKINYNSAMSGNGGNGIVIIEW